MEDKKILNNKINKYWRKRRKELDKETMERVKGWKF
jgi:hypothetical protein